MPRIVASFVGAAAAGAGLLFLFFIDPAGVGYLPRCPLYQATGLYCPGCGSMRATHQLLHGNLLRAIDYNPALLPALGAAAAILISPRLRACPATPKVILIAILAYGILRNIPAWPFLWLAPH